ncbi:MAG: glycosyltransferase family 39 protein [Victivallaceae bacterium]|nr:glycosyltransferase family 39 protein [Victivallaceae bacterium]
MSFKKRINKFIYNPQKIIWLSLSLSTIFVTVYCLWRLDMYRDVANCYAHMTREFGRGNWDEAFASNLPPMNIVLAGLLAMIGVEAYTATMMISGIFYILTIFPLYALLKRFFKPHEAAWGVLFFVLAPKIIRFSGTGLLESGRNFFLVLALLFVFKGLYPESVRKHKK